MNREEALKVLRREDSTINKIGHIIAALGWDQDTAMPPSGAEERGEQIALLSSLIHEKSISASLQEAIASLDGEALEGADAALYRVWKKEVTNALKLPADLVMKMSLASNDAHYKWIEAREKDDFSIYEESLANMVSLEKEKAALIGGNDNYYDTLLDMYEEGMSQEIIDPLFDDLEESIHSLMDKLGKVDVDDSFLYAGYEQDKLHSFCLGVIDKMGFDKNRGIVGITPHPYTTSLGVDDIRISTRYEDDGLFDPIGSITHETGHALYDMHAALNPETRGTSLASGCSMGLHESQSRFWENLMGRSYPFWEHFYPELKKNIACLDGVSLDVFMKAINKPSSSAIRVNADELTYNLHIILRYRIEKELFSGKISVKDLPERWNDLSRSVVRYEVKNNREGVLQDVHWSMGSFGYFPTYALGNIYSAQFLEKMYFDLGGKDKVDEALRSGNLSLITAWQDENIWKKGCLYKPSDLVFSITGSKIDAKPFKEYLSKKFTELYLA